jgi:ABC-type multidrug transport system ATPase subunit
VGGAGRAPGNVAAIIADGLGVSVAEQTLLPPVSFGVDEGSALAVVGANGSGKTTLLRVLAGLSRASRGSVSVVGGEPDDRRPGFRARVAALIGVPPLARNLTLHEYLVLILASWGHGLDEAGVAADGLLAELGIAALASRFPHELSSGQTQLYLLCLTLARPFDVLLLDEPEQRLDPDRVGLVCDAVRRRSARGVTVVVATHSQVLVERVADDVLTLAGGGLVPDGGAGADG